MKSLGAAVVVLMAVTPASGSASAQTPTREQAVQAASPDPKAQAMFEFMMARRLEAAGDGPGALASLERARKLDPQSAEISSEIAGYYFRQNRATEAIAAAEQSLKLEPDNVEAHNILGTVYAALAEGGAPPPAGQTSASTRKLAIEHLTAIQNSPLMATNPNLQMTLGRLHLHDGKPDVAIPILERVATQAPWAAEPQLVLYEAYIAAGQLDEAEQALVQAAEINPRYFAQLGQFYERTSKWPEAAAAYEEAIGASRQPNRDLQIRYAAALINVPDGAAKAMPVLNELLKASPNDTRVLYLVSTAQRALGDDKAAEASARKIVSTDPTSIAGLRALVSVLFDRFDYKQISEVATPLAKDLSRAKGLEFDASAVLVQLGIAEQQLAHWDAAINAFFGAK